MRMVSYPSPHITGMEALKLIFFTCPQAGLVRNEITEAMDDGQTTINNSPEKKNQPHPFEGEWHLLEYLWWSAATFGTAKLVELQSLWYLIDSVNFFSSLLIWRKYKTEFAPRWVKMLATNAIKWKSAASSSRKYTNCKAWLAISGRENCWW